MGEIDEVVKDAVEHAHGSRFNSIVALLVAIAATCMALDNIKNGNMGLGMAQAQAKVIDTWSYYQAKSTKQALAETTVDQLGAFRAATPAASPSRADLDKRIATYKDNVVRYEKEKAALKSEAEGYQRQYDALNSRHDQFDVSEAGFSVAIALLGVTMLTRKRWLFGVASVFLFVGVLFGLAGFLEWPLHPDAFMSWLT